MQTPRLDIQSLLAPQAFYTAAQFGVNVAKHSQQQEREPVLAPPPGNRAARPELTQSVLTRRL